MVGSPATGNSSRKRQMLRGRDWMAARVVDCLMRS